MNAFALTRALIDINSVTPDEGPIGDFLFDFLAPLAERYGGRLEKQEVAPGRNNVWAYWGSPQIVFSTHMDTVPPFIPSSEDEDHIWGRGACDTHGIAAAMIKALESLLDSGERDLGMLLVVGEEVDGAGARHANLAPPPVKFLINGEPTENKLALGSKGTLGLRVRARGRACHSAYPELGVSATEILLDRLQDLRAVEWPTDPVLGETTVNIGTLAAGPAANIVSDNAAASMVIRVVADLERTRRLSSAAMEGLEVEEFTATPALRMQAVEGFETTIVKYTTDIPKLSRWGQPLLIGPGSIHHAHTTEERIPKAEITQAIGIYSHLARSLKALERAS